MRVAVRVESGVDPPIEGARYRGIEIIRFTGAVPPDGCDFLLCPSREIAALQSLPESRDACIIAVGDASDIELCLELGCADYLRLPWAYSELAARVRKLKSRSMYIDKAKFLIEGHSMRYGKRSQNLGAQEKVIIDLLYRNIGQPVSRDCMFAALGLLPSDSRSIDMHISNLRKKLRALINEGCPSIRALRQKGYVLSLCGEIVDKDPSNHKALNDKG